MADQVKDKAPAMPAPFPKVEIDYPITAKENMKMVF